MPTRTGPPTVAGRWSRLPERDTDTTRRTHALAEALLDRHGVVTRGAVMAERAPGGFAAVYTVLKAFEEAGRVRRGYFVEGLGAAQFAAPGAVDRMRALAAAQAGLRRAAVGDPRPRRLGRRDASRQRQRRDEARAVVLAATDPANPYGAALPWPERDGADGEKAGGHKPARKAGALVVLVDGALVLYVERGGKTLLSFSSDDVVPAAGRRRAGAGRPRRRAREDDGHQGRRRGSADLTAGPRAGGRRLPADAAGPAPAGLSAHRRGRSVRPHRAFEGGTA